jgi:hypothetical protein
MAETTSNLLVREWGERFRRAPLARTVIAGLDRRSAEIWQRTVDLLRQESPEYRNSIDEEFTKESRSHCRELLGTIVAVAGGRARLAGADPFDFVRTHAEWRARHQVPLIASLHAYRLAHKTYSGITQEVLVRHAEREEALHALTMLSTFWIEFFDHVGAVLAEAHAAIEDQTAIPRSRACAGLIAKLLRGVEPRTAEARQLRTLCGIVPGASMAVAIARPFPARSGKPVDVEVTLRSVVRLLQQMLPASSFGKLVDIRDGEVVAIVSSHGDTARGLVNVLRRHRFGRGAGLGVSLDAGAIARLPECLDESRAALDFTTASRPLVHFAEIDLAEFLVRRADTAALRLIPKGTELVEGDLARTMCAFAECSLNVKQTAVRLGVHTNTVYFRLNRIHKLTGIDARTFAGASTLLAALRLRERS